MTIAIITDTHLGARNSSNIFRDYFRWYYKDVFFPYLKENGIKTIIHAGDFFENRNSLGTRDLHYLQLEFIPLLEEYDITMHLILGNHDVLYRNTNDVSNASVFHATHNVVLYDNATDVNIDGKQFLFLPWINSENSDHTMKMIENTTAKIAVGHLEIAGFKMYRNSVAENGLNSKIFKKFDHVWSGHFHHKNSTGNITYLGSPFHYNWQDYPDERGFHTFDTELEFVFNDSTLFAEIVYDNGCEIKPDELESQFVRVIVNSIDNSIDYEVFIDRLKHTKLHGLDVIDYTVKNIEKEDVTVNPDDLKKTTIQLMYEYFEEAVDDEDTVNAIKPLLKEIHDKAEAILVRGEQ